MGLGEVLKAIDAPAPEHPIASTSEPPAAQRHSTQSQSSKTLPSNVPTLKTSTSSPSKQSRPRRRRGQGTENSEAEDEPEDRDDGGREEDSQPHKSDKGKGKEVERSRRSSSSSSSASSSSDSETNAKVGEKRDLMIFQRTCSRSWALEDEKASTWKKLSDMAGRSVKKSKGKLQLSKDPQRIIIDLTGDVSRHIDLIDPRLIIL